MMVNMAHAQGLLVYGATITPFGANTYYSMANETQRELLNTFIKTPGNFDGVIDFEAAVTDGGTGPNEPKLLSTYDSGDGLHLNPAGYTKLASVISLPLFTK
jgi:lysophospholipase L1-like esterase